MRLVLASQSPRRRELLEKITKDFTIHPASSPEDAPESLSPPERAAYLARHKAVEVAELEPDALVLGCDTVVAVGDQVLGKPRDRADCMRMLSLLSGREHCVHTGVCLAKGKKVLTFTQTTRVWFYPLSQAEMKAYADSPEPYDKAGAYGIQGLGSLLVKRIEGDYFGVMGLPVAPLARAMKAMGYDVPFPGGGREDIL